MAVQLRRYAINKGMLDEFVEAWRKGVYPLRLKFGFSVPYAMIIRERNEFIWMVGYPGTVEAFLAREADYYASPERAAVHPNPAQWIARGEQWFVSPVVGDA